MRPITKTWYLNQFKYAEFNGDVHFFRLRPEIPYLGNFDPKNQNSYFKVKLDTQTD